MDFAWFQLNALMYWFFGVCPNDTWQITQSMHETATIDAEHSDIRKHNPNEIQFIQRWSSFYIIKKNIVLIAKINHPTIHLNNMIAVSSSPDEIRQTKLC